jgi:hypothetical protein
LRTAIEAVDRALAAAQRDLVDEVEKWRAPLLELSEAAKLETAAHTPLTVAFVTACDENGTPCERLGVIDLARVFARHAVGRPLDALAPSVAIPDQVRTDA